MKISTSDPGGLLQLPVRRWASTTQDYDLILSAFQYSLQRSILISSEQDIKCLNDLAVEPFVHQVENLKQFVNNSPQRMMLFDDVGLGKTISAGLILAELIRRRRITNFLVVCPTILLDQWCQELEEKFRFRDLCVGNWQRLQPSLETAAPDTLKVITTYNAVVDHRDFFLKRKWDFVVVDEGDYLKTLYTAKGFVPSARARTFYELAKEGRAEFFLLLTATPLRKNLWDVFNLAEISSQPGVNPIGTPQSFKNTFIADDPAKARRIRQDQQGEFRRRLTEISVRNRRGEQNLRFPERKVEDAAVPLSEPKRALLDLTSDYCRQRYNFLQKIEPAHSRQLIANWKSAVESQQPHSWEQLKVISDEIADRLGEYEFTAVNPFGGRYPTSLSYELVSQALLAFIERVKPEVTTITNPKQVRQFLSVDLEELSGRFWEEEIKRRRPNKLEEISLLQSVLSSPAAGAGAFRRKRARSALTRYEREMLDGLIQRAEAIHAPEKAKRLLRMVKKLRAERPHDYRLLVFTIRRDTQNFLGEYLEENGFRDQVCYVRGGCTAENKSSMADFNGSRVSDKFGLPRKHILISTDAGSAGVNLQSCNTMVNYDLPWVPMTIEQRIGRIQRLGQPAQYVIVNNFYIAGTYDQTIVRKLEERIQLFSSAVGELEAILQGTGGDTDFEEQIFALIMLSKEHRDEEVARQLERMNRAEALQQLREVQQQNEALLGALLSSKKTPRFIPRDPPPPRLDVRTFCQAAFARLGYGMKYHPDNDLLYVESKRPTQLFGDWQRYTFSEQDGSANDSTIGQPLLLVEETKEFHALLRDVLKLGGVFMRSCEPLEQVSEKRGLRILKQSHGDTICLVRLKSSAATHHVAWRLTWKVTAAVVRDRFEKLLWVFPQDVDKAATQALRSMSADHLAALPLWNGQGSDLQPPDKATIANHLTSVLQQDKDLLRFEQHYAHVKQERIERLEEWLKNCVREEVSDRKRTAELTQERDRRKDELRQQFTPSIEATLAMVEGFVYRILQGEVECTLERNGELLRFVAAYEWVPLGRHGQVHLQCWECRQDVQDQIEVCKAGHLVCPEHIARCSHPGCLTRSCRRCAPQFLDTCDVSGVYGCADHLKVCPSCGKQVVTDLLFRVEEAEKEVCPDCFEVCEDTGKAHLLSELERSDLSGRLVYHGLLHTCPVSAKRGLHQEMESETGTGILHAPGVLVTCAVTGKRIAPGRVAHSEVSGKACLVDYLQQCAVSGILALPDELGVCAETGQRVDRRLLATCSISGKTVLQTLLQPSPVSGQLFLPHFGVADEITGDLCLPDEITASAISGQKVRCNRLVASEWSQRLALPSETVRCAISGEVLLSDEAIQCEETCQVLSPRLIATCAVSHKRVCTELLATCHLTGQVALRRLMELSAVSGKFGLRDVMDRDEVDGSYALPDELQTCAVTGKRVTPDKLVQSEVSSRKALAQALVICSETGKRACPDDLQTCQATGIQAIPDCFGVDEITREFVLKRLLITCEVTGKRVLPEHTQKCVLTDKIAATSVCEQCAQTGQWVLKGKLEPSGVSGKRVLPELLQTSGVSGIRALPEEIVECEISGEILLIGEAVHCAETGQLLSPRLIATCAVSHKRVYTELLATCHLTGQVALRRLMELSAVSGKFGLRDVMDRDEVDGSYALPDELQTCAVTGKRVTPDKLVQSEVSSRKALAPNLVTCVETGKQVCPDELLTCQATGIQAIVDCFGIDEVTGRRVLRRLLVTCAVTEKRVLPEHTKECVLTGKVALTSACEQCAQTGQWVLQGKLEPSAVSVKRVLPALLRTSEVSGGRALPEEMERCQETGAFALPDELEVCQVSGRRVLPKLLVRCPDTGRRLLPQYGKHCAKSGVLVHLEALAASAVSGLVVRERLLVQSGVSDQRALPEEMITCGESGKRVLPSELASCELTGVRVLPDFLGQCAICSQHTITRRHVSCGGCSGRYCTVCVPGSLCLTCQSLQQLSLQPLDSLDAKLQEAILKVFPVVGRVVMKQNNQWVLVYGKPKKTQFWKTRGLLVFQTGKDGYTLMRENHGFTFQ